MAAATVTEDEPGSNKKHISDVEYHGRGGCIRCGDKVCDVDDHSGWLTAPDTVTLKDIRTPMAKHSRYEVARLSYQMKDGIQHMEASFAFSCATLVWTMACATTQTWKASGSGMSTSSKKLPKQCRHTPQAVNQTARGQGLEEL
jgi:hypothetical protein